MKKRANKGFTLVEMLVVMGLIGLLIAMMTGGLQYVQTTARQAQAQELVSNVATALTLYIQREGSWPDAVVTTSGGVVNNEVCKVLQQARLLDVTTALADGKINQDSPDRFGLLSPWGQRMVRSMPKERTDFGSAPPEKLKRHMLQFRVDTNLDGKIDGGDSMGAIPGEDGSVIRASAIVWSCGPKGKDDSSTGAKNPRENRQSWVGGGK